MRGLFHVFRRQGDETLRHQLSGAAIDGRWFGQCLGESMTTSPIPDGHAFPPPKPLISGNRDAFVHSRERRGKRHSDYSSYLRHQTRPWSGNRLDPQERYVTGAELSTLETALGLATFRPRPEPPNRACTAVWDAYAAKIDPAQAGHAKLIY